MSTERDKEKEELAKYLSDHVKRGENEPWNDFIARRRHAIFQYEQQKNQPKLERPETGAQPEKPKEPIAIKRRGQRKSRKAK